MATKIVVSKGHITGVYDDRLRPIYEAIGMMDVHRASNVEFNPQTGEWVALHLDSGREIARGRNRADVIQAEVAWLEAQL